MFIFGPTKREPTLKCTKCGLLYKVSYSICPHCAGKNKAQIIRDVHIPHAKQLREAAGIGRVFIYLGIIIACIILMII